ncbi:MAG TPA: SpoIIE family protein phosphatase [Silvibacterium sp.]|nr:SpoIIE family protein phosphatase [Silvibacterium sp.]
MGHLRNFEVGVFRRLRRDPPKGKIHRLAFWLLVVYLCLAVGRIFPGRAGLAFQSISAFTFFLLILLCIPLLWRWIFGRLLWKLSNRLVVTYLLMGLAPVVLFVTLAVILMYVFSGQFAIFATTAEIDSELAHISSTNRAFDMHVAHSVAADPRARSVTLPEADDTSTDHEHVALQIAAFADGQRLPLVPENLNATGITRPPSWAKSHFYGVVVDDGKLYLRAIDTRTLGGRTVTTITSLPLQKENVDQIARGLGSVTIVPDVDIEDNETLVGDSGRTKLPVTKPGGPVVVFNGHNLTAEEARKRAVKGGTVPEAQHFYDIPVTFYAPLETVDWVTGKPHTTFTHVTSRPSLLYQRLFISSLTIAAVVQNLLIGIAIFFGLLELIAFIMAVRLNRTITQSIRDLYQATVAIDKGDLTHRIQVTRHDQLAALSRSFNNMAASLERLLEEQREKERLQNELAIAQEVQANLFPLANISLPMLELHGACYPARTVSGDYYDFLVFGSTGLGIALGDISGKGISAALLMATLHSAVRAYRFAGMELVSAGNAALATSLDPRIGETELECGELFEEPGKILALLNRHIYRSTQPEKYATLFLAHYDGIRRQLIYSTGGHLPPLLLRADNTITRLDRGGTVVGLIDNMSYEQGAEQLYSGDILIAYSDGVTEPENEFGEFGEERMVEVVRRYRHLPLEAISEQVMQSLRTWIGGQEQPDDITLVLARQR